MHTVALATTAQDGTPRVRSVILRAVDPGTAQVRLHTDRRSAKLAELAATPAAALLAWDLRAKLQVRLTGSTRVHVADATARTAWERATPGSRVTYAQADVPGAPLARPAAGPPADAATATDVGFENFAVLLIDVGQIDALWLGRPAHRRAVFTRVGSGWQAGWHAP
jgi:hypothetical protein